jgi:hypothetical protein
MKEIFGFIKEYIRLVDKRIFACTTLVVAVLVFVNYGYGIERRFMSSPFLPRLLGFFLLYCFIFSISYLFYFLFSKQVSHHRFFYILLPLAVLIFALKISFDGISGFLTRNIGWPWNRYWYKVLHWPVKSILVTALIYLIWKIGRYEKPVFGTGTKKLRLQPYFLLLIFMIPLIAFAGTQADFLHTYPKVKNIFFLKEYVSDINPAAFLYEICYGIDFFTIEFFFRGFLVLAFIRYAGMNAILPMAAFYCTIHFGKPLAECISSYFGGIILGAVVYNTRSIWGGLVAHLGIAWMMEVAGYLGGKI